MIAILFECTGEEIVILCNYREEMNRQFSCTVTIVIITTLYVPAYIVVQDENFRISMIILQWKCISYNIDTIAHFSNILVRRW